VAVTFIISDQAFKGDQNTSRKTPKSSVTCGCEEGIGGGGEDDRGKGGEDRGGEGDGRGGGGDDREADSPSFEASAARFFSRSLETGARPSMGVSVMHRPQVLLHVLLIYP